MMITTFIILKGVVMVRHCSWASIKEKVKQLE